MEMCSYTIPEPGVRDVEISGIQDRPEEVHQLHLILASCLHERTMPLASPEVECTVNPTPLCHMTVNPASVGTSVDLSSSL